MANEQIGMSYSLPIFMTIDTDGEPIHIGDFETDKPTIDRKDMADFFEALAKQYREERPDDYTVVPEHKRGKPYYIGVAECAQPGYRRPKAE